MNLIHRLLTDSFAYLFYDKGNNIRYGLNFLSRKKLLNLKFIHE
jgi:hypothetical protein